VSDRDRLEKDRLELNDMLQNKLQEYKEVTIERAILGMRGSAILSAAQDIATAIVMEQAESAGWVRGALVSVKRGTTPVFGMLTSTGATNYGLTSYYEDVVDPSTNKVVDQQMMKFSDDPYLRVEFNILNKDGSIKHTKGNRYAAPEVVVERAYVYLTGKKDRNHIRLLEGEELETVGALVSTASTKAAKAVLQKKLSNLSQEEIQAVLDNLKALDTIKSKLRDGLSDDESEEV
jgi:hypothetical protein